jgi:Ras GTPase-activating protein 1
MEVVNPFILKNKERMIVFLDQLSNVSDPFSGPPGMDYTLNNSNVNNNSDTGKLQFFV